MWALGCGRVGVGAWGGGMRMGGRGIWQAGLGLSLSDVRESPPWASPSRIRIGGSGVIDRPTFRIPGSHVRAGLGELNWEAPLAPHSPQDGENASRSS